MDRKEEARKAYVATLNTLVPELAPWIQERLAKGQNAYQTLGEFKIALSNEPPAEVLTLLAQARPAGANLTSLTDAVLLAEVARRLAASGATAVKKSPKATHGTPGPSFSPQIAQHMIPAPQENDPPLSTS